MARNYRDMRDHRPRSEPTAPLWYQQVVQELRDLQEATAKQQETTNQQIATLTQQVTKLATVVEYVQSNHEGRIKGIEDRERERERATATMQAATQTQIAAGRNETDNRLIGILWGVVSGCGLLLLSYILTHLPR